MKTKLAVLSTDRTHTTTINNWPAEDSGVPGLVVCRQPAQYGDGSHHPHLAENGERFTAEVQPLNENRYYYQIVHVQSGISLAMYFYSKQEAKTFAGELSRLDWTVSADEIQKNGDYKKAVNDAYNKEVLK